MTTPNIPQYTFNNPDLTQSYPYLRIYHGNQSEVLVEAPPKGGDLWYDTTFNSYSVLRYYNSETSSWVLVQDYNTGASKNTGQEMFGDNTLCGSVTFSYATYTSSSSSGSSSGSSQHCGASSSEEASSSNDYTEGILSTAECVNPYAIFDGEMQSLGIGTIYPETTLHVSDEGPNAIIKVGQHYDNAAGPRLDLLHTRGTFLTPLDLQASDELGTIRALMYDSSLLDESVLGSLGWLVGPTVSGASTLSIKTHDGTSLNEVIGIDEGGDTTFNGNVNISSTHRLTLGNYYFNYDSSIFSEDGMMFAHNATTGKMERWIQGARTTISFFIDGDGAAISLSSKLDALRQVNQFWTLEKVRIQTPDGVTGMGGGASIRIMRSDDIDNTDADISVLATALIIAGAADTTLSFNLPKTGTIYETLGSSITGTSILTPDQFIYPEVTANNEGITKLRIFIELKATTA